VTRRPLALCLVALALGSAACTDSDPNEPGPLQIGSLGPVLQGSVEEAVAGLCDAAGASELEVAAATFADRAHQTLHVVAAAVQEVDRAAAAALQQTKQRVEADLAEPALPPGFAADVDALLVALRAALEAIGLEAPSCRT
jgi:hypothetical protein